MDLPGCRSIITVPVTAQEIDNLLNISESLSHVLCQAGRKPQQFFAVCSSNVWFLRSFPTIRHNVVIPWHRNGPENVTAMISQLKVRRVIDSTIVSHTNSVMQRRRTPT